MVYDQLKEKYPVVLQGNEACVLDLDNRIAALVFCGKDDKIGSAAAVWSAKALQDIEAKYDGVVVLGGGKNLCCGNAVESTENAAELSNSFQSLTTEIRHYTKPVVTLLTGQCFGFGYEVALNSHAAIAGPDVTGFGYDFSQNLPPMGGGLTAQIVDTYAIGENVPGHDIIPFLKALLNTVYAPKKWEDLFDAKAKGLLPEKTAILPDGQDMIEMGKQKALHLFREGFRPVGKKFVLAAGTTGKAALEITIVNGYEGLFVAQQKYPIAIGIAHIIGGGNVPKKTLLSEKRFLDLETEVFVKLAEQKRNEGKR